MATTNLNPGDLYFENMFNDATRVLEGGLWHNNVPVGNQGNGTDGRYINDLTVVQTGLTADIAAGDFSGAQFDGVLRSISEKLAKATIRAERAEALIDIQKKVAALLGTPLEDPPGRS